VTEVPYHLAIGFDRDALGDEVLLFLPGARSEPRAGAAASRSGARAASRLSVVGHARHMPVCRLRCRYIGLHSAPGTAILSRSRLDGQTPAVPPGRLRAVATGTPPAIRSPVREKSMTTALEMVGAFLLAVTLLTAAMFLAALHLGRLISRDDGQRA